MVSMGPIRRRSGIDLKGELYVHPRWRHSVPTRSVWHKWGTLRWPLHQYVPSVFVAGALGVAVALIVGSDNLFEAVGLVPLTEDFETMASVMACDAAGDRGLVVSAFGVAERVS